jgi:murein DD-endopeptidase MepM/ murein hydrolase activator NlpD
MDDWQAMAAQSPLAQQDWTKFFDDKLPTNGWWDQMATPYSYAQGYSQGNSFDYDPGSVGQMYGPTSGMTNMVIDSDIDSWLRREHPELFDFTSGVQVGGVAGAGKVGSKPGFGQFDLAADADIQAAASKYGVPANFLKAIIAHESSGNWGRDANARFIASRGERILPYIGVFESAAKSWGFNFDAANGNRAAQVEMLASGLRGMYDRLHAQNPSYGWEQVSNNHYSGDPTGGYTPGDAWQYGSTQQYTGKVMGWWKDLDAYAGNTWSNYTSTGQNTGIGSPSSQAWGKYARWDQALVGLGANTGAPANLLKAFLRVGDESGLNYSSNFDGSFTQQANALAASYRQTGDWNTSVSAVLDRPIGDPLVHKVTSYWNELNADASGLFGGAPGATLPTNQLEAVWGNVPYGVSQENGPSAFASANPNMYEYSLGVLGVHGHPGMDITFGRGTKLFSPASGTIIETGSNNGYRFYENYSPNSGAVRILLDNGHHLILGHMMSINVKAGDRVTPGMLMGLSGGAGTGDHLHIEYRIPDSSMSSGWRSVDPRAALSGAFTGFHQGAKTGLGYTQPLTFQALMRAGASGEAIPSGAVFAQGGGNSAWTNWLRNAMVGAQDTSIRAGKLDYGNLYNTGGGGTS